MSEIVLVFIGAGFGGVSRFLLGSLIYAYTGRNFPYGTLVINLTGSFLMGILYVIITQKYTNLAPELTALILVGALGGYTTFSSFSIETLRLIQEGRMVYAGLNMVISNMAGIFLAWLGYFLATRFV